MQWELSGGEMTYAVSEIVSCDCEALFWDHAW